MNEYFSDVAYMQESAEELSLAFERDSRRYSRFISEDEEDAQW